MKSVMFAASVLTAMATSAADLTWVGGSEGDWNTAANWDPQQVPTNKDTVFFDSAQSITVNLGATQVFATLSVSNTPRRQKRSTADTRSATESPRSMRMGA